MMWSTLDLGTYQLRFVSWVFHVIFSLVHFISFDTLGGLRAFRKPFYIYVFIQSLDCKSYILMKIFPFHGAFNADHPWSIANKTLYCGVSTPPSPWWSFCADSWFAASYQIVGKMPTCLTVLNVFLMAQVAHLFYPVMCGLINFLGKWPCFPTTQDLDNRPRFSWILCERSKLLIIWMFRINGNVTHTLWCHMMNAQTTFLYKFTEYFYQSYH